MNGSFKKIINDPCNSVKEYLLGIVKTYNYLNLIEEYDIIIRNDIDLIKTKNVSIISGGGSGHSPSHELFVGQGMLSAAVCGNFFSSPSVEAIYECIKACTSINGPGCLLIVKNYTGDILNFGLAKEMAIQDGLNVKMIVIGDDIALMKENNDVGRRGLAGTVFIHKIAGALSEKGEKLNEIFDILEKVSKNIFTIGISLGSCIVPGNILPNFVLNDDEFELGLGIHGEKGLKIMKMMNAKEIVQLCFELLLENCKILKDDKIIIMINNLGSVTIPELYICANEIIELMKLKSIKIEKLYIGTYMTALEMPGLSFTILNVSELNVTDYIDSSVRSHYWHYNDLFSENRDYKYKIKVKESSQKISDKIIELDNNQIEFSKYLKSLVSELANKLIISEEVLSELDSKTGDGDFGLNMSKLGHMVLESVKENKIDFTNLKVLSYQLSLIVQKIGGTSGAVFGIFLLKFSQYLNSVICNDSIYTNHDILNAFKAGINGVTTISGAKLGYRTFLDSLIPAVEQMEIQILKEIEIDFHKNIYEASIKGSNNTKLLFPKKGRSSYLGERVLGYEDPGAKCISYLFEVWYNLSKDKCNKN